MLDVALKEMAKQFKVVDGGQLVIDKLVVVYLKPDTEEPFRAKKTFFSRLDLQDQNALIKMFKKVVAGKVDKNLYTLAFKEDETSSQEPINDLLNATSLDDFANKTEYFVANILDTYDYDKDVCLHIANVRYDTEDQSFNFIIGTVNFATQPKSSYVLDIADENDQGDFTLKNYLQPIIKLTPENGFMYPSFIDKSTLDMNNVLVYNAKTNVTPVVFVDQVMGAEIKFTAKEERDFFKEILRKAVGVIKPTELSSLYESIDNVYGSIEDEFDRLMSKSDFTRILNSVFGELEADLDVIYEEVIGVQDYSFKAPNILPAMDKKSIEIRSDRAQINIDPISLRTVKQVKTDEGQKFLLIKITGDSTAEGISFESDEIETITFNNEE